MEEKEALRREILEAEQDVEDLENELWNRSRDIVEHYEDATEEDLDSYLNAAQNHFSYLRSCWESEYPEEDWYDE